jgi:predicted transcriptional regulator
VDNGILVLEQFRTPEVIKALNSELRRQILALVYEKEMNINQIAEKLQIPQSTCAVNVQMLEKAGLLRTFQKPATKGLQKMCRSTCQQIVLTLHNGEDHRARNTVVREMPIGLFFDFEAKPSCGLASTEGLIGFNDQPESFLDPHRAKASLIWFADGFIEYRFPFEAGLQSKLASISVSAEICSEFPQHNDSWPSNITLWINSRDAGTWTSPGDMGDRRGHFTPKWWEPFSSQYGFLKTWTITNGGCMIDGVPAPDGSARLNNLGIEHTGFITIRFGIKQDAEFRGGINIFGKGFGNYDQDIRMVIELSE